MTDLVAQLLRLVVAWTGYPEPAVLPVVHIVSAAEMPCPCLGAFLYSRQLTGYGTMVVTPARLLLRDDVDLQQPYGRSILLHELVHALQAHQGPAGFGSAVWHRREREAYRVQYRFLRAAGAPPQGFVFTSGEE
jgi:hypothetical protein